MLGQGKPNLKGKLMHFNVNLDFISEDCHVRLSSEFTQHEGFRNNTVELHSSTMAES